MSLSYKRDYYFIACLIYVHDFDAFNIAYTVTGSHYNSWGKLAT